MTSPVRQVVLATNALGLGGTEKGLVEFALALDLDRFAPRVVAALDDGPRRTQLEAAGVPVAVAHGDEGQLAELLAGADVVHVFRAGNAEPLVPAAARRAGVTALVETNIFGNVDASADRDAFAAHLFMSKMTLMRYRDRLGTTPPADFHLRHRALASPIGFEDLQAHAATPAEARSALGLDPERPTVGRVGRADDLKWRNLVVDMVPHLLELVPDLQVLFVGATPAKVRRLERLGVRDRCLLLDPVLDVERLGLFYRACDVFVSAAEIGESQGMGINEALALGVPVVTCSTPWADNAQVEFVDHGRTGWLAAHPRSFAEACAHLLSQDEERARFGRAAREDMERQLSRSVLARRLETLYAALADGQPPPASWEPDAGEVERFAAEYPARAAAEFRRLTRRERVEVDVRRRAERGFQLAHAVRGQGGAAASAARAAVAGRVRGSRPGRR